MIRTWRVGLLASALCLGSLGVDVSGQALNAAQKAGREKAMKRLEADRASYTKEQIADAEALYQVANKDWRSASARASLRAMVEKYPNLNRTGCAVLYLAQMAPDAAERERLLKEAIEQHGDSFYLDGVQVGAFARFLLAQQYQSTGRAADAGKLFDELKQQYPDSIDHRGERLVP